MRLTQLLPLFFIAPVWGQCDMEIYGYNPYTTEITIIVNGGHCLTEADSIGEFLLGLTFDPPVTEDVWWCVDGGNWSTLIFPLDFPGFDIGQGTDDILQTGDTLTFVLLDIPLFGSGTGACWIEALQEGAWYDECVVLAIYQINDSETLAGTPGPSGEPYPDEDVSNNILIFSLGPICEPPPLPYRDPPPPQEDPCVYDEVYVPNAFTPNNDGRNDVFRAVTNHECWFWFEMSVWNRWGQKVWETDYAGSQWFGNVTYRMLPYAPYNGEYYAPDGVYYWMLEGERKNWEYVRKEGHVTLIR